MEGASWVLIKGDPWASKKEKSIDGIRKETNRGGQAKFTKQQTKEVYECVSSNISTLRCVRRSQSREQARRGERKHRGNRTVWDGRKFKPGKGKDSANNPKTTTVTLSV